MSDAEVKSAAAPARKPEGRKSAAGGVKKGKKSASHPKYTEIVKKSIEALKERWGSSRQAIHKHIVSHFDVGKDTKVVNTRLKLALKHAVQAGVLKRSNGTGASGSFRLADKAAAGPKKSPVKRGPKKAGVAKPKKAAKPKAGKSPKKAAKPKAPTAAKPKTATAKPKVAKKPKSPKKATPPKKPKVAKKATPKKAAAKKYTVRLLRSCGSHRLCPSASSQAWCGCKKLCT